jgi:hypothetical protein
MLDSPLVTYLKEYHTYRHYIPCFRTFFGPLRQQRNREFETAVASKVVPPEDLPEAG